MDALLETHRRFLAFVFWWLVLDDNGPLAIEQAEAQEPDGTDPNDIWQDVYSEPQE